MVVQPVGEAHCGERRERALASYGSLQSAVEQRQLDIGLCGRPRDEVETLENEPDAAVASIGQLRIGQLAHVDTIEARAELLAPAIGADAGRLLDWCTAFAGMTALELSGSLDTSQRRSGVGRMQALKTISGSTDPGCCLANKSARPWPPSTSSESRSRLSARSTST